MAEVKKSKENVEDAEVKGAEVKKSKEKKFLVETKVKNYCGEIAGVQFAYGKAEVCEGYILDWFRKKGYKVTAL